MDSSYKIFRLRTEGRFRSASSRHIGFSALFYVMHVLEFRNSRIKHTKQTWLNVYFRYLVPDNTTQLAQILKLMAAASAYTEVQ